MRLGKHFVRGAHFAALTLAALCFVIAAQALTASPPAQGGGQVTATTSAGNGLRTFTFNTSNGRIFVYLPDDMAAGDTVSGTLVAEPRGGTEAERAGNLASLKVYVVDVGGQKVSAPQGNFTWVIPDAPVKLIRIIEGSSGTELANAPVPAQAAAAHTAGGTFRLPVLGQQGRHTEIFGPFDGDASNTTLRFIPPGSDPKGFGEKTGNVAGGFGLVNPLAESPRKIVFVSPPDLTGPAEVVLKEGGAETRGPYRSVSVRLSAPKTNLTRGERTTLTVEVGGLGGIRENVPLQLDSRGVIQMDGGNFQNLSIKPQEVKPDGRYTLTRAITGQQAGGFTVTATVIVRRFDMCLQDDRDPRSGLRWNTFTGDYVFISPAGQPGAPGGAGGTPPTAPASPPGGVNLTGIGKPAMKGCIITLSHNTPDRRVFARLDVCAKNGSGEVQPSAPKTTFNVTDSNTADSACPGN